ncbi:hypothetical protein D9758_014500 [Tetrapyrgos nigripes]|uniref:Uncharacterized protein n=1 Tax=Tetrapyrgos nigripes TaxID=182062 RepID=A0A8H5CTC0_9AGAR|nr:hypothetical protein D9758_014500 [Tetrapyrgos nigripes]
MAFSCFVYEECKTGKRVVVGVWAGLCFTVPIFFKTMVVAPGSGEGWGDVAGDEGADSETEDGVAYLPDVVRAVPARTTYTEAASAIPSIELKTELIGKITGRKIDAIALLDSGAEGVIINNTFAQKHHLNQIPIEKPFLVQNVDGSENVMGWVTHYTIQKLQIYAQDRKSYHEETAKFYIMDIGDYDIILGTDWLEHHNPEIDWAISEVNMARCADTCVLEKPLVKIKAKSNTLPTRPKQPEIVDPRTYHQDYQVSYKEPIGHYKPVAQPKIAGQR